MAEFDFSFKHKVGKVNLVADAFSKKAEFAAVRMIAIMTASKVTTDFDNLVEENFHRNP